MIKEKLANAAIKNVLFIIIQCLNIQISSLGVFFNARKNAVNNFRILPFT